MRFSKVLFIRPKIKDYVPEHPPAGLGYLAEALSRISVDYQIIDMCLGYTGKYLFKKISAYSPRLLAFSLMTLGYRNNYLFIKHIKKKFPDSKVVVGGPHVSIFREEVLSECPDVDYAIVMEGDKTLLKLCNDEEIDNIEGLVYRDGAGRPRLSKDPVFIKDLNELGFPKYSRFELTKYLGLLSIPIVTSRGCPSECTFCPVTYAIGRTFRVRSSESVIDEISYWYVKGVKNFLILDDNFTLIKERVFDICDLIESRKLKNLRLSCPNGIRADTVNYELLKRMRSVGFYSISFGVESCDEMVLKNIKKREDIETIDKAIDTAIKLGFEVSLFFLVGPPGETLESFQKSIEFTKRYPIYGVAFNNLIPYPKTELYNWAKERDYLVKDFDKMLSSNKFSIYRPFLETPDFTRCDRIKALKLADRTTQWVRRHAIERRLRKYGTIGKLIAIFYTNKIFRDIYRKTYLLRSVGEFFKRLTK